MKNRNIFTGNRKAHVQKQGKRSERGNRKHTEKKKTTGYETEEERDN